MMGAKELDSIEGSQVVVHRDVNIHEEGQEGDVIRSGLFMEGVTEL